MIGPKETQKKYLLKVIQTIMRAQIQELSLCVCLCAYPYVLYAFSVNSLLVLLLFVFMGILFLKA
jgi:hypothetical protein